MAPEKRSSQTIPGQASPGQKTAALPDCAMPNTPVTAADRPTPADHPVAAADRAEIPAWILRYAPFVVSGKPADEAAGDQHEA